MAKVISITSGRFERLLKVLDGKRRLMILTHDNPDPDSIASAMGLQQLVQQHTRTKVDIAYGGYIGRAENRAMIRLLKIDLLHATRVDFHEYDATAVVDTQPGARNHSLPLDITPTIVVDHHPPREESEQAEFADVGGDYGSTTTKVLEYLRASQTKIDETLATALFYGVKSDTRDLGRESNQADFDAYRFLIDSADLPLVSEIEHPQVPREYFRAMVEAFKRARVYDSAVVVNLGEVYTPDLCAELSDRLLQADGIRWSLAMGVHANQLYVSIRTRDKRRNAGKLIAEVITERGMAGGHGAMAGARQPLIGQGARARKQTAADVIKRFLKALDVPADVEGESLIAS
ncbi:MAG: DHH family phosphoesterase [Deltaproteobacteria bacterium]|nr:DHH family phosphoesterase [Deltaproteobacteria bacterium]